MSDAPPPARRPRPSRAPSPRTARTPIGPLDEPPATRTARRQADRRQRRLRRVMLGGLAVAVLAGGASIAFALTGGDGGRRSAASASASLPAGSGARLADPDAAATFIAAASSDIGAVTSYDYRRLDDALDAGLAVTTGSYRQAFRAALTGELAATARADRVVHDFEVLDAGIGELSADGRQAKVLIFGRQVATDRTTRAGGQATLLTLRATIRREGGRYLIAALDQDADAGLPPGSPELRQAAQAGKTEVGNVLTYSRAGFAADLRRALDGAADPLRSELPAAAATTRSAMAAGHYDLRGTVVATAVKSVSPHSVTLLVAATSTRITDGQGAASAGQLRYEVTVTDPGGRWVVSRISTLAAG